MEKIPDPSEKYIEALIDGRKAFLTNLARHCGQKAGEYTFLWSAGGLEIIVDDLKFLLMVTFLGRVVVSNEEMIFVDGDWWKIVGPYKEKIEQTIKYLERAKARRAMEILIENNIN